jgi:hypothetical protein
LLSAAVRCGQSAVLGLLRETFVACLGFGGEWRETRVDR